MTVTTTKVDATPTSMNSSRLIATTYVLDKSWTWSNGPIPVLSSGQWTAVTYEIPVQAHLPIHELGLMILAGKGSTPYSGPLYRDSVGVQPR